MNTTDKTGNSKITRAEQFLRTVSQSNKSSSTSVPDSGLDEIDDDTLDTPGLVIGSIFDMMLESMYEEIIELKKRVEYLEQQIGM